MNFNHRFPGQYRDSETGLYQNWFRDYDARLGRYVVSDPIGLGDGPNTFGYAKQNPISFVDPNGQCAFATYTLMLEIRLMLGLSMPIAGVIVGAPGQSPLAIAGNIVGGASNLGTSYLVATTAAGSAAAITSLVVVSAGVGGWQIGSAIGNLPTGGGQTVINRTTDLIDAVCTRLGKCPGGN